MADHLYRADAREVPLTETMISKMLELRGRVYPAVLDNSPEPDSYPVSHFNPEPVETR